LMAQRRSVATSTTALLMDARLHSVFFAFIHAWRAPWQVLSCRPQIDRDAWR
jgi:hypothetical protein